MNRTYDRSNETSNETSEESAGESLEDTAVKPCDEVTLFGPDPGRTYEREVLVLGIGNILWADEGFGPRAAEAFHTAFRMPEGCEVMDGGTLGGYLLNDITVTRSILVFDCCDFHEAPGTVRILRGDDITLWASTKISPHQQGFNDLLCSAALLGKTPERIAVVGVQPERLDDYGGSLSDTIRSKIPQALELARAELAAWGFAPEARAADEAVPPLDVAPVAIDAYETGRPSAQDACRTGDERFLVREAGEAIPDAGEK
ncbi:HyaD/HybD family hydrogenase maturation endopeptidase [Sutterella megalosphaeroides]|uniref:Hydrogenase expression/formation protein n=1 Tax=Sutterella megalosphaeroides TaxID=2494234 RepID=A0A2Z6I9P6_9BURK|nr:HyaD/HybD family hydrogenase maturation endopeptidase [Sutterella megalosphaeroides]BBF23233.1 hydrogenase expression/formation protein [Sutterella megalosphaeroides]